MHHEETKEKYEGLSMLDLNSIQKDLREEPPLWIIIATSSIGPIHSVLYPLNPLLMTVNLVSG
jgi:hypothetical protein